MLRQVTMRSLTSSFSLPWIFGTNCALHFRMLQEEVAPSRTVQGKQVFVVGEKNTSSFGQGADVSREIACAHGDRVHVGAGKKRQSSLKERGQAIEPIPNEDRQKLKVGASEYQVFRFR